MTPFACRGCAHFYIYIACISALIIIGFVFVRTLSLFRFANLCVLAKLREIKGTLQEYGM